MISSPRFRTKGSDEVHIDRLHGVRVTTRPSGVLLLSALLFNSCAAMPLQGGDGSIGARTNDIFIRVSALF
jgi:hypothetical protein